MEQVYGARVARLRRRRRRRLLAMWAFSLCTMAALLAVGYVAVRLDRLHETGITATAATYTRARVPVPVIHDGQARLSYDMLGPPWRPGCPAGLNTTAVAWTSGESVVAGQIRDAEGAPMPWYGGACAGPLPVAFGGGAVYGSPRGAAYTALRAIAPAYYGARRYTLRVVSSAPVRLGRAKAWRLTFLVRYPGARPPWSAERGALIVVNQGPGELYYVSVPGNLPPWLYPALIGSLR